MRRCHLVGRTLEVAHHDLLIGIGCDYGQGYWFAKPLGAHAFELFMASGSEAPITSF